MNALNMSLAFQSYFLNTNSDIGNIMVKSLLKLPSWCLFIGCCLLSSSLHVDPAQGELRRREKLDLVQNGSFRFKLIRVKY